MFLFVSYMVGGEKYTQNSISLGGQPAQAALRSVRRTVAASAPGADGNGELGRVVSRAVRCTAGGCAMTGVCSNCSGHRFAQLILAVGFARRSNTVMWGPAETYGGMQWRYGACDEPPVSRSFSGV